jgi:hypothetical protein
LLTVQLNPKGDMQQVQGWITTDRDMEIVRNRLELSPSNGAFCAHVPGEHDIFDSVAISGVKLEGAYVTWTTSVS